MSATGADDDDASDDTESRRRKDEGDDNNHDDAILIIIVVTNNTGCNAFWLMTSQVRTSPRYVTDCQHKIYTNIHVLPSETEAVLM